MVTISLVIHQKEDTVRGKGRAHLEEGPFVNEARIWEEIRANRIAILSVDDLKKIAAQVKLLTSRNDWILDGRNPYKRTVLARNTRIWLKFTERMHNDREFPRSREPGGGRSNSHISGTWMIQRQYLIVSVSTRRRELCHNK
jgi:hypothetical protein